ncbi:MAG TPA: hypothetical protein VJS20_08285, partial [Gemmatimonadales bacterium]|nr:hypothetical protein [Gemmatimonadales bacterium]
ECWGDNKLSQLAAVTDTPILSPVAVSAPTTFTAVTSGQPSCALGADGKTYCWSEIYYDGALYGERPVARTGPALVTISSSNGNVCGMTGAGAAYCLGDNEVGQLGNGQVSSAVAFDPVAVTGGVVFSQVSDGMGYACGIGTDSVAYCWGDPYGGETGTGVRSVGPVITSPVAILGGNKFQRLSSGNIYTCGITTTSALLCWGTLDLNLVFDSLPTAVDTTRAYTQVANGVGFGQITQCAIAADSSAYCWGSGLDGELGNGTSGNAAFSATPVLVSGGHKFVQVTVGANHACGITSGSAAYCWGLGTSGALGTGDTSSSSIPVAVTGGHAFASISAGLAHTCGVTTAGVLYCWGNNDGYELGLGYGGENAAVPIPASGGVQAQVVSAGNGFFCALGTDQLAYCWGYNQQGQLGRGDSVFTHATPAPVAGGHQFTQLVSSGEQSCALTGTGQAYCWGNRVLSPQAQQGAVRFQSISVGSGGDHVCGVTTAREVLCWSTPVPPAPPRSRSPGR